MPELIVRDSLTLEETNKNRISLGLKPIGVDVEGSDDEDAPPDQDAIAEANFEERRLAMKREKEERELKEKMDRLKNQRELKKKLTGATLGDASKDDGLSAKDWARKLKKRSAKREADMAARRQREMDEADKIAYDEGDLTGIKVAHDAEDFQEGEDIVLTLKDSGVLGGDEDELQNVNLADYEKDKAAKERKRKANETYTGYDDGEFEEGRIGQKSDVLSKYDDEFSTGATKSEGFRLGAPVEKKAKVIDDDVEMFGAEPAVKIKLGLDFAKGIEVSDYMQEGDKGFKVKKRRAKKSTRKAEVEDDDMDVDPAGPTFSKRIVGDGPDNLVDDEDLQAALARSRRENAKKKPKAKPEDLAARIAKQKAEDEAAVKEEDNDDGDDGRITFDETSEFVRNVTAESRAAPVKAARTRTASPAAGPSTDVPVTVKVERVEEDGDAAMSDDDDEDDEALAEMAAREGLSIAEYRERIDAQMQELSDLNSENVTDAPEAEAVVSQGMGSVLSMLRNSGSLEKRSAADEAKERQQKQHDLWMADYKRRQAERELERIKARGGNKDQAQREYENRLREQSDAREALQIFKDYKPDVNIVYHDEFGRQMTPKEAWKSLSHKFHGKTSGRMKTEKRLRKIEEERKQYAMAAGDTPTGMGDAFARRQQKTGEAFMVLSAGNKASVQKDTKGKRR